MTARISTTCKVRKEVRGLIEAGNRRFAYTGTRVDVSRKHCIQVGATIRE